MALFLLIAALICFIAAAFRAPIAWVHPGWLGAALLVLSRLIA